MDEVFRHMVERVSDQDKPGARLHAYLEDNEGGREEEGEDKDEEEDEEDGQ